MDGRAVFTVGHSTRSAAELLDLLRENGVAILADIRSVPGSRRNPQFGAEALARSLAEAGLRYVALRALGGRRGRQAGIPPETNAAWTVDAFRNYADYALGAEFERGLEALLALRAEAPVAILCAEAVWWRCHRRIVTDHLLARGVPVRHILAPGKTEDATPTPFAVFGPGARVTYPDPQQHL